MLLADAKARNLSAGETIYDQLVTGAYHDFRLWIPPEMTRCTVRLVLKAKR